MLRVAVVARQGEVYEEDAVASRERRVADVARHVPEVEEEKLDPIGGGDGRIRDECRGDEQSKYPHARRALAFGTLSRPYQLLAQVRYRAGAQDNASEARGQRGNVSQRERMHCSPKHSRSNEVYV